MKIRKPTTVIALSLGIVVLISAGGAYAYWTVNGSGTGTATISSTLIPLKIEQTAVTGLVLGQVAPLTGTIENPNGFEVSLKDMHLTVTGKVTGKPDKANGGNHQHPDCTFDKDFTVKTPTVSAGMIPAKGNVPFDKGASITLINRIDTDQSACQGVTVTLAYVLQ